MDDAASTPVIATPPATASSVPASTARGHGAAAQQVERDDPDRRRAHERGGRRDGREPQRGQPGPEVDGEQDPGDHARHPGAAAAGRAACHDGGGRRRRAASPRHRTRCARTRSRAPARPWPRRSARTSTRPPPRRRPGSTHRSRRRSHAFPRLCHPRRPPAARRGARAGRRPAATCPRARSSSRRRSLAETSSPVRSTSEHDAPELLAEVPVVRRHRSQLRALDGLEQQVGVAVVLADVRVLVDPLAGRRVAAVLEQDLLAGLAGEELHELLRGLRDAGSPTPPRGSGRRGRWGRAAGSRRCRSARRPPRRRRRPRRPAR